MGSAQHWGPVRIIPALKKPWSGNQPQSCTLNDENVLNQGQIAAAPV